MKAISPALAAHLEGDVTTLATCWKLVRMDGTAYYFTDHDQDILYLGNNYKSASGYDRSAIANDSSLAVDNLDILGILDNEAITEEDLRNGLFDYARVEVFMVNWLDLTMGELRNRAGRLGEVTVSHNGTYSAELRGMSQALSQRIGELYSSMCRADLGDNRCKVVLLVLTMWAADTAYEVGDTVVPTHGATRYILAPYENMAAEAGDMTGWTEYLQHSPAGVVSNVADTFPLEGGFMFYLEGTTSGSAFYQTKTLAELGLSVGDEIFLEGYQANPYTDDTGYLMIRCRDNANTTLAEVQSTPYANPTLGEWTYHNTPSVVIPEGTTYIRIYILANLVSGSYANHCFDALRVVATADENGTWPVYFECTNAGTSGPDEPDWPTAIGAELTETYLVDLVETEGPTWVAKEHFTRYDFVSGTNNQRSFYSANLGQDPSNFVGGTVEWVTGENTGKVMEIKSVTGGLVTMYLPMNYTIAVGDEFIATPGCTKKLFTCRDTYNNVLNFRGEPFIPGQDEYLQYPDAK
ncbi:MAG: DUF2163 domain-containing protein [Synergistaceae bacterium]